MPAIRFLALGDAVEDLIKRMTTNLQFLENLLNGQMDGVNIADGGVGTSELADAGVTFVKLANDHFASGTYTGDGTQNREISLGWRARYVQIIRGDNSDIFTAWGNAAGSLAFGQRNSSGTWSSGAADFQGCSANGFKLGSAVGGGRSNANTQTYAFSAWR